MSPPFFRFKKILLIRGSKETWIERQRCSKQGRQKHTPAYTDKKIDRQTDRQTDRLPLVWLFQHFLTTLRYLNTGGRGETWNIKRCGLEETIRFPICQRKAEMIYHNQWEFRSKTKSGQRAKQTGGPTDQSIITPSTTEVTNKTDGPNDRSFITLSLTEVPKETDGQNDRSIITIS